MIEIECADLSRERQSIREIFGELLQWTHDRCVRELGVGFDREDTLAGWMAGLHEYAASGGCLVVARVDSAVAGVCCVKTIGERLGEFKHMYIRPAYRGQGLGRRLLEYAIGQSSAMGHARLRLETGRFMQTAQALYRSCGFREIPAYPENEVPPQLAHDWVFMEKPLVAGG